jgi:hypothetical protein
MYAGNANKGFVYGNRIRRKHQQNHRYSNFILAPIATAHREKLSVPAHLFSRGHSGAW